MSNNLDMRTISLLRPLFSLICGFDAEVSLYVNFSLLQVKEKEQAHKEYKEAISKGHGAYLMDQEKPVRSPCL